MCWSSTKRTSPSSHQNETYFRHDIAYFAWFLLIILHALELTLININISRNHKHNYR